MPKKIVPLVATTVANAKPKAKPYKLRDGNGLYLLVTPDGAKLWRMDYRRPLTGKQNTIGLGHFKAVGAANRKVVSLDDARDSCAEARKLLAAGIDPCEQRKTDKADKQAAREASKAAALAELEAQRQASQGTFRAVAESWMESKRQAWATETRRKAELVMRDYLLPTLGDADMRTLTSKEVLDVLEPMAKQVPNLARKARGYIGRVVRHAMRQELREDGRLLVLDSEVITDAVKTGKGNLPAATKKLSDIRAVVFAVNAYPMPVTRAALTVAMLSAQRPGNVVAMEWAELDLDAGEWAIPAHKMKMQVEHTAMLPRQAVEAIRGMLPYTGGQQYVFPPLARQRTPHLHRDTLSRALRESGLQGKHAAHGFRAMFRTAARERLNIAADVLEAQLAHAKQGEVQEAYDRATFDELRKEGVQTWADYLDSLRVGGNVVAIGRKAG